LRRGRGPAGGGTTVGNGGMNMIEVFYIHVRKYYNETPLFCKNTLKESLSMEPKALHLINPPMGILLMQGSTLLRVPNSFDSAPLL
jgi:hypothetical protein